MIANLTNIEHKPVVGDILYGSDAYYAQITRVGESVVEFIVVGQMVDVDSIYNYLNAELTFKENQANKKTTLTDNDVDYPTTKAVKTAIDTAISQTLVPIMNWNTATKTLALSDTNKLFVCSHTDNQTLTIPTNATVEFPIGTMITFLLTSTYTVTFSGASGVTLTSIDSLVELATQFAMASLIKTDTNTWQLVGALE